MTDRPDGKRALFSAPSAEPRPGDARHELSGKATLFSAAVRRPGTLVLDCESCGGRTRVDYVDFARRHLPWWLWLPWRGHSRWMRCPACEHRAWLAARWFE